MVRPVPLPFWVAGVFGFMLAAPLDAQAVGSRLNDTLYTLASDSAAYRDQPYVYLLDEGVIRLEPDGRSARTYRQVIWVLKESAIEQWSEFRFSHQPGRQRWTLNWARVVAPGGTVITPAPDIAQESDVPAAMESPVYVDQKVNRLTLGRVRVGSIVDVSYTLEDRQPWRPGDFFATWVVNPGMPVRRSRLVLDAPKAIEPRVRVRNLPFQPTIAEENGRRVTTWATRDVPSIKIEPFAADSNDVIMSIDVAGASDWKDVGAWFAGLARDRYAMTPALERKVAELVRGARTLDDSIRALHRYVADEVRYVSVSLGIGGYQPRPASEVLASGFGDCKDKAVLFIALLRRIGVSASPVLLNNGGDVTRELPSIAQFDHAIAAVDRPGGRIYVDLTASRFPWGQVPGSIQGQFALVMLPNGNVEEVEIPEDDPEVLSQLTVKGTLDSAGLVTVHTEMAVGGALANMFRVVMAEHIDSATKVALTRQFAAEVYPEAEGDSLALVDDGERVRISFLTRQGRAAQLAGPVAVLNQPFQGREVDLTPVIAELNSHRPRKFPIDVSQLSAAAAGRLSLELEMPAGWEVQVPKDIELTSAFGVIRRQVRQRGRILSIHQETSGQRGIMPPGSLDDLIAWLRQVATAARNAKSVVVKLPETR
ncbi:MAG: DUF3857 domain-containing transglutaminase family protein [Gemmatimonadales bacterium]